MSRNLSLKAKFSPLHQIDSGDIDATYMGIGYALERPARIVWMQNYTDGFLYFSQDGIEDHLALPSLAHTVIDLTANRSNMDAAWSFEQGSRFYVRHDGSAPTDGAAFISYLYAE